MRRTARIAVEPTASLRRKLRHDRHTNAAFDDPADGIEGRQGNTQLQRTTGAHGVVVDMGLQRTIRQGGPSRNPRPLRRRSRVVLRVDDALVAATLEFLPPVLGTFMSMHPHIDIELPWRTPSIVQRGSRPFPSRSISLS